MTERRTTPVPARALRYGSLVTLVIAVVGSVIGFIVSGVPGILSALMGALLAAVFMGLTAVSMLVAWRVTGGSASDLRFFGIVVGAWIAKLLVFVGVAIWLRWQSWLDPMVFFVASLAAVVGFLIVDIVALQTSRIPYVDVPLPGDEADRVEKTSPDS
ncbi:hypothetical protein GCM10022239_24100 [Leifsonia bigeumensis]|uniref:ATP synthase protein I n=1 Tax=Leifsonella bigeumensis TaxID=433643 RepID=A0ABP7FUL5_9MICO